jgi:hypothetical protein
MVVVAGIIPVGVIPVHWLNGGQNIGPTNIVVMCKIIHIPQILRSGVSTSPPNPTSIGGGVEHHQLSPSNVCLPPALSLEAGRWVLDGLRGAGVMGGILLRWRGMIQSSELLLLSLLSDIPSEEA